MRSFKILGAAFLAVLAFGVVAAASASAAPQWLLNGAAMAKSEPATTTGLLLLKDTGVGVKVHCEGKFLGTVGVGSKDLIETVEGPNGELWIKCKVVEGEGLCGKEAEVMAENLPWPTELLEVNGEVRDDILAGVNGEPAYEVKCLGGLKAKDLCSGPTSTKITVLASPVPGEFDANSPNGNCTAGGAKTGEIRGNGTTSSPNGKLEVS